MVDSNNYSICNVRYLVRETRVWRECSPLILSVSSLRDFTVVALSRRALSSNSPPIRLEGLITNLSYFRCSFANLSVNLWKR